MQSTPGDRQPLENEGLKAGMHGRGAVSITSHTTCIGPSNTYSGSGLERIKKIKKTSGLAVRVCARRRAWLL